MSKAENRRVALRLFMAARKLKPHEWAARAGMSNANPIYNFLNGRSQSLSQKTLEALADAEGVTIDEMFDERPVRHKLRAWLKAVAGWNNWTLRWWAKQAGVRSDSLYAFLERDDTAPPDADTIFKLERVDQVLPFSQYATSSAADAGIAGFDNYKRGLSEPDIEEIHDHGRIDIEKIHTEDVSLGFAAIKTEFIPIDFIPIPEIDIKQSAGGGMVVSADHSKGVWPIGRSYIRYVLGVSEPEALVVVEVHGDSMEPTLRPGDRVVVDTSIRVPSPPGIFVLWDGVGPVVKRVENIHGSDPATYRIISDNPKHGTYERTAEQSNIVGRVVWLARRI